MLLASLTKRLVNHAGPRDMSEGYTACWTMDRLRDAARRTADKIDERIRTGMPAAVPAGVPARRSGGGGR